MQNFEDTIAQSEAGRAAIQTDGPRRAKWMVNVGSNVGSRSWDRRTGELEGAIAAAVESAPAVGSDLAALLNNIGIDVQTL